MRTRIFSFLLILFITAGCKFNEDEMPGNSLFRISWKSSKVGSWKYAIRPDRKSVEIKLPVFEIDGRKSPAILTRLDILNKPVTLSNGVTEFVYEGAFLSDTTLRLQVRFRIAKDNPVVRFRYVLKASGKQKLTKTSGNDKLIYLSYSAPEMAENKEIRFSVFNEMIHSCKPGEVLILQSDFANSVSFAGPILVGGDNKNTFLCAYEHDSMYPNNFLTYGLQPDKRVELRAVKGNYLNGQPADGYQTIWFEVAGVDGDEDKMAEQFRTFMLKYQSENEESRKPYIYYNTWGRQERVKWAGGQYLTTMTLDYTLREIERAHEMGIDVYVLDAGWFDKTGDWGVNLKNFPDGFKQVREKIESYGMKFGVWMNPAKAAVSSHALSENTSCVKTWNGAGVMPWPEWETEESTDMCLVSPYWERYADRLIRLHDDLGITYFYWDAVGQSGCNDPGHFHGDSGNTPEERAQSYGFLLTEYLGKIREKVHASCPKVIFDFDVTESRRIGVGLQFLSSGRFFILNNGPYFRNFDLGHSLLPNDNHNIFIQPGPARTWFMRSVLDYDKWIPSNLFLANYQPDDPAESQIINLASLVLGQNSVWGEILKTSPEGVMLFRRVLDKYKQVRQDVEEASPIHIGSPGDTPEIYEKINPRTGKGEVVIFANTAGKFSYITKHRVSGKFWHTQNTIVETTPDGYARIDNEFKDAAAAIVFFGIDDK